MYYRKNNGSKILSGILAVLLVLVIAAGVVGVGYVSDWFTDWTKFEPEQPADEEQGGEEELPPVVDENGETMESGTVYAMPARMMYTSAATTAADGTTVSSSPITLEATITPDTATDKSVKWSVSFVNPSSEWATGKIVTDYVSISSSGLTCTVTCHQAFGEQIKITVTSNDNPEATDSCVVDYLKRIEDVTFALSDGTSVKNSDDLVTPLDGGDTSEYWATEVDWTFDGNGETLTYDIEVIEGVGTVSGDYSVSNVTFNLNSDGWLLLGSLSTPESLWYWTYGPARYENGEAYQLNDDNPLDVTDGITFGVDTFEHFFGNEALDNMDALGFYFLHEPAETAFGVQFFNYKAYGAFFFDVTLQSSVITSGYLSSVSYEFPVNINPDTFVVPVNDIGLNDSGTIIF